MADMPVDDALLSYYRERWDTYGTNFLLILCKSTELFLQTQNKQALINELKDRHYSRDNMDMMFMMMSSYFEEIGRQELAHLIED